MTISKLERTPIAASSPPSNGMQRTIRVTRWVRESGGRLRFPETRRATVRRPTGSIGEGSAAVALDIDGVMIELPERVLRHAAEQTQAWWRGAVVVRSERLPPAFRTALVVVPVVRIRHGRGRVESVRPHVSLELEDEPTAWHLPIGDLGAALGIRLELPRDGAVVH